MATAVHKKQTESKYVSCFADSRPDVDITFRDVLLLRPTDHYLVGIDNFSLTNTTLSMIEPMTKTHSAFLRIIRKPSNTRVPTYAGAANADDLDLEFTNHAAYRLKDKMYIGESTVPVVAENGWGASFVLPSTTVILNIQQLLYRLNQIAGNVSRFMREGRCTHTNFQLGYNPVAGETTDHIKFELRTNGQIVVVATRAFWANFAIEIPAVRNQFALLGKIDSVPGAGISFARLRRFLTIHPDGGELDYDSFFVTRFDKKVPEKKYDGETDAQFAGRQADVRAFNTRTINGNDTRVEYNEDLFDAGIPDQLADGTDPLSTETISAFLQGSVFSSLERRVALEVGCSLPIKNSPMIDHQKETPDFVLGRWMWRMDPRIESNERGGSRKYHGTMPSSIEYQGAQDRITYHELQAQSKIQTLRIKLFVRLRTFDEINETWGMRVIAMPTMATDWWHTRIHFISKD